MMKCDHRESWVNAGHRRVKESSCPSCKLGKANKGGNLGKHEAKGGWMRGGGDGIGSDKQVRRGNVG